MSVFDIVNRMETAVSELKGVLSAMAGNTSASAPTAKCSVKRSAKRAASPARKLQGAYMAAVRPLSQRNRAKVKAARAKGDVRSAIALAKSLAK